MPTINGKKRANSSFNLERFLQAQDRVYENVIKELKSGKKKTHWMWYIFPQIYGLGRSATSKHYEIKSLEEAKAYLKHPVLGPRLKECTKIVFNTKNKSAHEILGHTDARKLKSCMTLFDYISDSESVFGKVITKFYNGKKDRSTIHKLESND